MLFSIRELFDIVVMSAIVGYIFMDIFKKPIAEYDPLIRYNRFDFRSFYFSIAIVAPAIILHELAHKFTAISFGLNATFNAAYLWLGLGVLLKLMNIRFIFFVPAYVSTIGISSPMQSSLIAGAGPFLNLVLWISALLVIKFKLVKKRYLHFAHLTKVINMFLFIFNILPIPGFDGFQFFVGLIKYLQI